MKRFVLLSLNIVYTISLLLIVGMIGSDPDQDSGPNILLIELENENFRLRRENSYLHRFKAEIDEIDSRIASLKSEGYLPDELLVRQLQKLSRKYNISNAFVDEVLKTESSFWAAIDGPLGEVGGFQLLPETLYRYLRLFGVDPEDIDIEDYKDIRTNSEWAYVMFLDMRLQQKKLEWVYWNTGWEESESQGK